MPDVAGLAGGIIGGIGSIGKLIFGARQARRGRKMAQEAERNRPTYSLPSELNQALGISDKMIGNAGGAFTDTNQSLSQLPAWYKIGMGQSEQDQANAMSAARRNSRSAGDLLGSTSSIAGAGNRQRMNLLSSLSQFQQSEKARLDARRDSARRFMNTSLQGKQGVLGQIAGARDKEFAYNKWIPYQNKTNTAAALMGGGAQNIAGSFNDLASAGYMLGGAIGQGSGSSNNYSWIGNYG
jgi:hypothetical protein